jgi:hypothetical protein
MFDIDAGTWSALVAGVARREYNLLLGAGASIGAIGGDGAPLPNAAGLADELTQQFSINTGDERLDLREAYEAAAAKRDRFGGDRLSYLRRRFTGCAPTWHRTLAELRWNRAWTLNIDDVVQQAFRGLRPPQHQTLRSYSWDIPFADPDRDIDELQLVHLHGRVTVGGDTSTDNLVFSILEYLNTANKRHSWHRVFGDHFLVEPFIVVGARLSDEYDLAEFLRRGNRSRDTKGRPSLIVLKEIPTVRREMFTSWGLIPVESTADQFFATLLEATKKETNVLSALLNPGRKGNLPTEALTFNEQFRWLRSETAAAPQDHDFYGGDEPLWADILADFDAPFDVVPEVVNAVDRRATSDPSQVVHLLSGGRGAGKSASLLRIGRELLTRNFDVFMFRGEARVHVPSALWWLRRAPRTALLFDGVADFASDVQDLVSRAAQEKIRAVVIGTERDTRVKAVYQAVRAEYLVTDERHRLGRLSEGEVARVLAKLDSARRLGRLTRASNQDRVKYFQDAGRQLLVAMVGLETGAGFVRRISDEFNSDIKDDALRLLYGLTCVTHSLGYPLPTAIACSATGLPIERVIDAAKKSRELAGVVRLTPRGLTARHRMIASLVVQNAVGAPERFDWTNLLAQALAPYVNEETISTRSLPYLIIRHLMDEQFLIEWLGLRRTLAWYDSLQAHYDWNARFWEQRALAETRLKKFAKARSYAERAVAIRASAFSLNTLGTVLLRIAVEGTIVGSVEQRDTFWEGIARLDDANRRSNYELQHPFNTFFVYALRWARQLVENGNERDARLLDEWLKWMRRAQQSPYYKHPETAPELRSFQQEWLMLTAARPSRRQAPPPKPA